MLTTATEGKPEDVRLLVTSLADPDERTVIEYSDRSMTVL